jgi:hypothetical protein
MTLTVGMAIWVFLLTETGHNHEARPITGLKWTDYRRDCGYGAFVNNPHQAVAKFDRIY